MSLSVMTLSSSSSGNAVLVTGNGRSILIDCGIPVKRLKDGLETAGIKLNDVEGILLTHEHDDHIRTAAVVSENYGIPVYGERRTLAAVKARTNLKGGFYFSGMKPFMLAGMEIRPFPTPHDAVCPVGYSISAGDKRYVQATDIGWFSPEVESAMRGADMVLIESNHDIDMLLNGKYPPYLKERILSRQGHLSNGSCSEAVLKILDSGTRNIILGHLSEHNNTVALAYETTLEATGKRGAVPGRDYLLAVADARKPGRGVEV